jgi:putative membrane protein
MIPHFSDHAANERTYLAWVRTALAVVGLGFLLERFDLFLAYLGHEEVARAAHHVHLRTTEWIGLILIGFGSVMIFFATVRFVQQRREISAPETIHYRNSYGELVLAGLLVVLGVFLLFYIGHELVMLG